MYGASITFYRSSMFLVDYRSLPMVEMTLNGELNYFFFCHPALDAGPHEKEDEARIL